MELYIWWTSQQDCEILGSVIFEIIDAPEYLNSEYRSRLGRAGRGRLWVAQQFDLTGIKWDESKAEPLTLENRAGIVIAESELDLCLKCPGVVTDLEMNQITEQDG